MSIFKTLLFIFFLTLSLQQTNASHDENADEAYYDISYRRLFFPPNSFHHDQEDSRSFSSLEKSFFEYTFKDFFIEETKVNIEKSKNFLPLLRFIEDSSNVEHLKKAYYGFQFLKSIMPNEFLPSYYLGLFHEEGLIGKPNFERAVKYYECALRKHYDYHLTLHGGDDRIMFCQFRLAKLYKNGQGTEKSPETARILFQAALTSTESYIKKTKKKPKDFLVEEAIIYYGKNK
tara:strand:- start:1628 stop:2323 length:696 start_codon:yes stop_codon:yes gene_type:complete